MSEPRSNLTLEGLSLHDLHSILTGIAMFDRDLNKRLYDQIQDLEGRMNSDEVYKAAEGILKTFTSGIGRVAGYQEAAAEAFLSIDPRRILIYNKNLQEWWKVRYERTKSEYESGSRSHYESLAIYDQEGSGFNVNRTWWERSTNGVNHAYVKFISDPTVRREGQLPVGTHSETRFAVDSATVFLTDFLVKNQSVAQDQSS